MSDGIVCPVCTDVERLLYTATRCGLKESWIKKQTFSDVAIFCPNCGRRLRNERM